MKHAAEANVRLK